MHQVRMPPLSETMEEETITRWHIREGDAVRAGQPLFDVETDKATVEVSAPVDGTVKRILVTEGQTAAVGEVVRSGRCRRGRCGRDGR